MWELTTYIIGCSCLAIVKVSCHSTHHWCDKGTTFTRCHWCSEYWTYWRWHQVSRGAIHSQALVTFSISGFMIHVNDMFQKNIQRCELGIAWWSAGCKWGGYRWWWWWCIVDLFVDLVTLLHECSVHGDTFYVPGSPFPIYLIEWRSRSQRGMISRRQ